MHSLIANLLSTGPALTDGAWGTQLQARGLAIGEFPDAWNLRYPEKVAEVAQAYVDAGSRIILTNTFGSNPIRLHEAGYVARMADLNRAGVEISRQAAAGRAAVFASIGPTGKMVLSGDVTPEQFGDAFSRQSRVLAESGADALVIETMSDLTEACEAVTAAAETGLPVVACMTFDSGRDLDRTMMGITPEQAAKTLARAGASVIGANCGQGIAGFAAICRRLKGATDLPIWIKANAGLPTIHDGQAVYDSSPAEFASHARAILEAGASFIGGCCGTNPDSIRALRSGLVRQVVQ